jgi:hypothetical protein
MEIDGSAQPYRPANGSEGDWFEAKFCDRCERDREWREKERNPCPIMGSALAFAIDQEGFPPEWIEDSNGPRCTAFQPTPDG